MKSWFQKHLRKSTTNPSRLLRKLWFDRLEDRITPTGELVLIDSPINGIGTFADTANGNTDDTSPGGQNLFTMAESGTPITYYVSLNTDPGPSTTITVTLQSSNASFLQLDGSSTTQVTFTTADWTTWKPVIVTAPHDFIDYQDDDQIYSIKYFISGGAYAAPTDTQVTVTDIDEAGVTITPVTSQTITENSPTNSHQYSIRLDTQPLVDTTVFLDADDVQVGVDNNALLFTTTNWNIAQIVTVTAIDDFVDEAATHSGNVVMTVSAPGDAQYDDFDLSDSDSTTTAVTYVVNIIDNDDAGLTLSSANTTTNLIPIVEGGNTYYTVVLSSQPTAPVTIALAPASGTSQLTLSTYSLTFTPTGTNVWSTPQTVIVTAVDNFSQDATTTGTTRSETISLKATSNDPNYSTATSTPTGTLAVYTVQSNITDNDIAGVTVSPSGFLTVTEAGTPATYTFVLNTKPSSGSVTVNLSTPFGQVTPNPSSLTFTTANWFTPQAVSVSAIADQVAESTLMVSGLGTLTVGQTFYIAGETGLPIHTIVGTVTNPATGNTSAVTLSPGLRSAVLNGAALNGGGANPVPGGFAINYSNGYAATVGVINYALSSGTDSNYSGLTGSTTADVVDSDVAGIVFKNDLDVVGGPLALTEGDSKLFFIKPTTRPAQSKNVTILISPQNGLKVNGLSSTTLTFDFNNWDYKSVLISAPQDTVQTGPINKNILLTVQSGGSSDPQFLAIIPPTGIATITDIDTAGVNLPTTLPTLSEGGSSNSYNARLNSKPVSNVTLTLNQGSQLTVDRYTGFQINNPAGYAVGNTTMLVTTGTGSALTAGQTFTVGSDPVVHTVTVGLAANTSGTITFTPPLGGSVANGSALTPAGANPVLNGRFFGRNEITISAGNAFAAGQTFTIGGGGTTYTVLNPAPTGAAGQTLVFTPPLSGSINAGDSINGITAPSSAGSPPIRTVSAAVIVPTALSGVSTIAVDGGITQLSKGDVFYIASEGGGARLHTITNVVNAGSGGSTSSISFTPSIYGAIADNSPLTVTPASQVFNVSDSVTGLNFGPTISSLKTGINTITVTGGTGAFALTNTFRIANADGDNTVYTVTDIDNDAVTFTPTLRANVSTGAAITAVTGGFSNYQVKNAGWTNGLNTATGLVNDGDTFTIWDGTSLQGEFVRTNAGITGTIQSHTNAGADEATSTINFSSLTLAGAGSPGWIILVNSTQPTYTFTPYNWNTSQRVTVSAVRDFIPEGTSTPGIIQYLAASADTFYNNIILNPTTIPILDTVDPISLLVNKTSVSLVEGGTAQTFTVSLNAQPTNTVNVTLTIPVSFQSLITLNGSSSASLSFDSTNSSTAQTVTVQAINNSTLDLTRTTSIFLNSTSVDTNFNLSKTLSVSLADANNTAPVNNLPSGTQTTGEGNSKTFSVLDSNAFSVSDEEATGVSSLLINLSASNGTLSLGTTNGLVFTAPNGGDGTNDAGMSFTGTLSAINQALDGLIFYPNAGFFGTAAITIKTNDQNSAWPNGALTTTSTLPITVNANPSNAGPKIVVTYAPSDLDSNGDPASAFLAAAVNNPYTIKVATVSSTAKNLTFNPTGGEFFINGVKYTLATTGGTTVGTNGNTGTILFDESLKAKVLAGTIIYDADNKTSTGFKVSTVYDPTTVNLKKGLGGGGVIQAGDHVTLSGVDATGAAATQEVTVTAHKETTGSTSSITFTPALTIAVAIDDLVTNVTRATNEEVVRVFSKANGNGISVSDPQYSATSLLKVTVDLDSTLDPTAVLGTLNLGSTTGLTAVLGNGTSTIVFQGTLARINAALDGLKYTPPKDLVTTITLNVRVDELAPDGDPVTPDFNVTAFTFDINPVNDRPTLALSTKAVSLFSGAGSQTIHIVDNANSKGGPAGEADISSYVLTFSNPNILTDVSIDANGDFTFSPASAGTTSVNVIAKDPEGTDNGGIDTSLTQTFTITVTNSIKWTDSDGDIYTITLTGPGTLTPTQDLSDDPASGPIANIQLSGTTANSALAVTVNKVVFDGIITIGGITSDSPMGTINLAKSDLIGPVTIAGTLGSMTVRNISDDADIIIGGNANSTTAGGVATSNLSKATITATDIGTADITADSVLTLKARSYGQGVITAPAIADMTISNDFQANLDLKGFTLSAGAKEPAVYTLKTAKISGQVAATTAGGPTWNIVGKTGKIEVLGLIGNLELNVDNTLDVNDDPLAFSDGKIESLVFTGGVTQGNVTADTSIGAISANKWLGGGANSKITAVSLGSLTITDDFFADLDLTGTSTTVPSLGNTTINGDLGVTGTATTWELGGYANNLTVLGAVNDFNLDATGTNGKIATVKLGTVKNSLIEVTGSVGAVTVASWDNTTSTGSILEAITGASLASLTVAGNFHANLTLSGTGSVLPVLSVGGNVTGTDDTDKVVWEITNGSAATLSVKGTTTWLDILAPTTTAATKGNITSLTLGKAVDTTVEAGRAIGTLKANSWTNSSSASITAGSISNLSITGTDPFVSDVTLTGTGVATNGFALSSASFTGAIEDSIFDVIGKVKSFQAGSFTNSQLLLEATAASATDHDPNAVTFDGTRTLTTFIIKGAYTDSLVAASTISQVTLGNLITDAAGADFGFASEVVTTKITVNALNGLTAGKFTISALVDGDDVTDNFIAVDLV